MEKFPGHLLTEIKKRASLCMQKPAVYCRAVLEHANQKANRNEYEQPLRGGLGISDRGVSGFLPVQYSNRRTEIHEETTT